MDRPDENKAEARNHLIVRISFFLQLLAFILSFIAFFAPFWYIELNTRIRVGLWGRCDDIELECIWFLDRNYAWERSLPSWHVASQVMFAIGIGILFISCVMAIGNIMFKCCKLHLDRGTCPIIFGVLIVIAMIFQTVSITIFGIGAYQVYECSINSWVANFEWAFYVGISSLFSCLIAAIGYLFSGYSIHEDMKGYDTADYYS